MQCTDYYCTMEIDRTASENEIKHAYRRLAKRFHPDVSADPDGERKFKAVAEAYRTLKHPASRAAYDGQIRRIDARNVPPVSSAISFQHWLALFSRPIWLGFWSYWAAGLIP